MNLGSTKVDQWVKYRMTCIESLPWVENISAAVNFRSFKITMKLSDLKTALKGYPKYEKIPLHCYVNSVPSFAIIPSIICGKQAKSSVTDSSINNPDIESYIALLQASRVPADQPKYILYLIRFIAKNTIPQ